MPCRQGVLDTHTYAHRMRAQDGGRDGIAARRGAARAPAPAGAGPDHPACAPPSPPAPCRPPRHRILAPVPGIATERRRCRLYYAAQVRQPPRSHAAAICALQWRAAVAALWLRGQGGAGRVARGRQRRGGAGPGAAYAKHWPAVPGASEELTGWRGADGRARRGRARQRRQ